jgi:hypothetical protein
MSSRQLMAVVAGTVTSFVLGYVLYGMLLMDFFMANAGSATGVPRDPPVWWALIVGNVVYAYLLVVIFEKWPNVNNFGAGAKAGALLAFLFSLSLDLIMYATTNISNLTATLVDPVVSIVFGGVVGGVVGLMLGRTPAAA